ncbi:MAG TPA: TonB-dependent receptor [Gammaproteobacteria bacterium]|nr:TonB-dependent receptor [Gammaproteobacteria bacterium]
MSTIKGRAVACAPRKTVSLQRKQLGLAIATALAFPAIGVHTARAQNAPPDQLEQITVTGSRIVRRDYDANSPIQTIDRSSFEQQNSVALETALNELPQFVPAAQGMTQLQDQSQITDNFATLTAGASTISLRGLGANRNLVLLDGYRAVPVNATMAVDVNSIPAAAIERVEVITGGASSVYGADAVAGVVNFILKKDFQGLDLDVQTGSMQNGEGAESRASALFGVSNADETANIMVGMELARRQPIHADDTDFWSHALRDGTTYPTQLIYTGPYFTTDAANAPSRAAVDQIFNRAGAIGVVGGQGAPGRVAGGGNFFWNEDGTVYTGGASFSNNTSPAGAGGTAGAYRYNGPTYTSRANANVPGDYPFRYINNEGAIVQHILPFEANIPLDRTSVFGRATYDISDTIQAYAQVLNVSSDTRRFFTDSPAVAGWGNIAQHGNGVYGPSVVSLGLDNLPNTGDPGENMATNPAYRPGGQYGLSCGPTGGCSKSQAFPVSPELAALLDSRQDPEANWSFNYGMDFGDFGAPGNLYRSVFSETRTNQMSFGLKGEIEGIDGTWDIVASRGEAKLDLRLEGYASLTRVRALLASPNWGKGFFAQGNSGAPGFGFSGGIAQCTSGVPVFGDHVNISQDCLNVMYVTLNHQSKMDQKFIEGNVQGRAFMMPAGEARFSAGVHSRTNSYYYIFDPLQTENSFNDNPEGFPADNTKGETSVDELYGELLLPVFGDDASRHLNLELGYRYSDYELQGGVSTYKALVDWGITDTLRFRGGRQLATRAPNIAELFQSNTQSWSVQFGGEPCATNSSFAYSANPAANPANAAAVRALCSQIIGTVAPTYYSAGQQAQINAFVWLPFVDATGNPQVNPEEAKTLTAGIVWSPNSDREWLNGLNLSVDYYDIKIDDMISVEGALTVYQKCLSAASNPTFSALTPSCRAIHRNPVNGTATTTTVTYVNAAFAEVSGVDLTADWSSDIWGGEFGVNFMISQLLDEKTQDTVDAPVIDWKGSLGPFGTTSLNNGAFDYRTFTTLRYGRDAWNLSLRWRHLPSAIDAAQAVINSNIAAGRAPANTPPSTGLGAQSSYDVFDLAGSYGMGQRTTLRYGIDNLFDADAVCTGGRSAADAHPSPCGGQTEAGFYDILGRSAYVGVNVSF